MKNLNINKQKRWKKKLKENSIKLTKLNGTQQKLNRSQQCSVDNNKDQWIWKKKITGKLTKLQLGKWKAEKQRL